MSCMPCWGGSHGFAWFHTKALFTGFCKAIALVRIVAHNSHQLAHTYLLMRICVLYLLLLCRIFLFFFNRICENAINCLFQASSCFVMFMDHYIANAINTNKFFGHLYKGHILVVKTSFFNNSGLIFTDVFGLYFTSSDFIEIKSEFTLHETIVKVWELYWYIKHHLARWKYFVTLYMFPISYWLQNRFERRRGYSGCWNFF